MAALEKCTYPHYLLWLRKKKWKPDEAAFLLCGLDPDSFDEWSELAPDREWQQYREFDAVRKLIDEAVSEKKLGGGSLPPPEWINWASTEKVRVPSQFANAIAAKFPPKAPERSKPEPNARSRDTMLIIMAGCAESPPVDLSRPSKAATVVARTLELRGTPIPARTIEEYFRDIPPAEVRRGKAEKPANT